ncbi:MAG TPA: hypothetical protein VKY82_08680 [Flavobacterium sp.]|nr:hypothetical protein [Flavobacterium sp.]
MKNRICQILFLILMISCKSKSDFKTIDFDIFEISVPQNWKKIEMKGIDSYVGGIVTEKEDTLTFDIGLYSEDATKNNLPLVFDTKNFAEFSYKEKERLKKTNHLIIDSLSEKIDFSKYLPQKFEIEKIDCFEAKIIRPTNKGFGTTGIYIDSLEGSKKMFNKLKMSFYGEDLSKETEIKFIKALKTIRLKKYCHHPPITKNCNT